MPKFTTPIPATGSDGNVYVVLGNALRLMKELGVDCAEQEQLAKNVMRSGSYEEALDHVRVWFSVDLA